MEGEKTNDSYILHTYIKTYIYKKINKKTE